MCGILGLVERRRPVDAPAFRRMLDTLAQRGPDGSDVALLDEGRVALGHTRLAIVDLSDAGAQPMANEDGSVHVVANGEIYDHAVLRRVLEARGHVTFTNSSTNLLCVSGPDLNACAIEVTGDVLTQFETFAGVVIRF